MALEQSVCNVGARRNSRFELVSSTSKRSFVSYGADRASYRSRIIPGIAGSHLNFILHSGKTGQFGPGKREIPKIRGRSPILVLRAFFRLRSLIDRGHARLLKLR
jgi:hypothetical protein